MHAQHTSRDSEAAKPSDLPTSEGTVSNTVCTHCVMMCVTWFLVSSLHPMELLPPHPEPRHLARLQSDQEGDGSGSQVSALQACRHDSYSICCVPADCMAGADVLLASMGRRSEYGLVKYVPARFLALRCLVGCQDRWAWTSESDPYILQPGRVVFARWARLWASLCLHQYCCQPGPVCRCSCAWLT